MLQLQCIPKVKYENPLIIKERQIKVTFVKLKNTKVQLDSTQNTCTYSSSEKRPAERAKD